MRCLAWRSVTEGCKEAQKGRAIHNVGGDAATVIENGLHIEMETECPICVHAGLVRECQAGERSSLACRVLKYEDARRGRDAYVYQETCVRNVSY